MTQLQSVINCFRNATETRQGLKTGQLESDVFAFKIELGCEEPGGKPRQTF